MNFPRPPARRFDGSPLAPMNRENRIRKKKWSILLLTLWMAGLAPAQQTQNEDRKGFWNRIREPYRPLAMPLNRLEDTPRLKSLIRGDRIPLTLEDAISLAIENNLDVGVQRYVPIIAAADSLRARSGATIRGLPLTYREGPPGVGGPTSTSLPGGTDNSNSQSDTNLSLGQLTSIGAGAFSAGSRIPNFDLTWTNQVGWNHRTTPQTTLSTYGSVSLVAENATANTGFQKGFGYGTQVSLAFNNSRQNLFTGKPDYNPYTFSSLGLTVTQPLLQGFGTAVNRRFITIARNNEKIADLAFQQQLVATVASVVRLYYDLVSLNRDVEVKQQALKRSEALLENNRIQVEVGTLAPIEAVRAQAEVARSQQALTNSEGLMAQQELILKNFISRKGTEDPEIQRMRLVPLDPIRIPPQDDVPPLEKLLEQALQNRPDFLQSQMQLENARLALKGSRHALLPQLDLVGTVQNNALAAEANAIPPPGTLPGTGYVRSVDPALLGGYGTALSQILRRHYPDYGIYFQLNIPLNNRQARADMMRDQAQTSQAEMRLEQLKHQVRTEVEAALIALKRTRASFEAARQARLLQEDALQAEQEKYAVGATTSFFLIQYQRDLVQARSDEVLAESQYAKARNALDRAVGQILTRHNIQPATAYQVQSPR